MAEINGKKYKKITRTVGHRINEAGVKIDIKKQFYGTTKKECERKYKEYLNERCLGIEDRKQYFGIVADNWIRDFFINDNELKESTKNLYVTTWRKYIVPSDLYHMELSKVRASVIQRTYNKLSAPPSAMKTIHKMMRKLYKYLDREDLCRDITGSLVLPLSKKDEIEETKIVVWENEEIARILSSFDKAQDGFRLRFFVVLAYYTGCRISELLALKYEDFTEDGLLINKQCMYIPDFQDNGKIDYHLGIVTPKTKSSIRTIPIADDVKAELEKHRMWQREDMLKHNYRTGYVFTTSSGKLYDDNNVRTALNRYYKNIGITVKPPHTYRHTFGTNLCKNGVPIEVASALLGHTDISVTAKYYVGVSFNQKLDAVNTLSLNNIEELASKGFKVERG